MTPSPPRGRLVGTYPPLPGNFHSPSGALFDELVGDLRRVAASLPGPEEP